MGLFAGYAPGVEPKNLISAQEMKAHLDKPVFRIKRNQFNSIKLSFLNKLGLMFLKLMGEDVEKINEKIKYINEINKFDYVENKWYGHNPELEFECQQCGKIFDRSNIRYNLCNECRGAETAEQSAFVGSVKTIADLPKVGFTIGEIRYVESEEHNYVYLMEGWIKVANLSEPRIPTISRTNCEDCGADITEFNSYIYIVDNIGHQYCSKCFIIHRKSGEKVNFKSVWGKI